MATAYHKPPSQLARISNPLLAYQFDGAVRLYGQYVEREATTGKRSLQDIFENGDRPKVGTAEMLFALLGDGS